MNHEPIKNPKGIKSEIALVEAKVSLLDTEGIKPPENFKGIPVGIGIDVAFGELLDDRMNEVNELYWESVKQEYVSALQKINAILVDGIIKLTLQATKNQKK